MIDFEQFASEWYGAWNSHDLPRIMSHYADEVVLISPRALPFSPEGRLAGKKALAEYFAAGLARFPDLEFTPISLLTGTGSAVLHYTSVEASVAAELMVFDGT